MPGSILKKLFPPRRNKTFSAWQIELTTRCPLQCKMCIREGLTGWQAEDMDTGNLKKILPYLADVRTVLLQGWGEPLLHKDLIEIIKMIKREGPEVGFITSGKGLHEEYASSLVESGLDFISFSLSGMEPGTHDAIRVHSDLAELTKGIRLFAEMKAERGATTPELAAVFLMLKNNIREVVRLPEFARDAGIQRITLINLIHITNAWQEDQKVFACDGESVYGEILEDAEKKSRQYGIAFQKPSLQPREVAVCGEDPLRNLYISVNGEVSPCVFLYPPVAGPFRRIFCGREQKLEKTSFGNIFVRPFPEIWHDQAYRQFREAFQERRKIQQELWTALFDREKMKRLQHEPLPGPPEQCLSCHKMLGF